MALWWYVVKFLMTYYVSVQENFTILKKSIICALYEINNYLNMVLRLIFIYIYIGMYLCTLSEYVWVYKHFDESNH